MESDCQRPKECFVPTCGNNSINNSNKLFVEITESLKETWCRQVNTECFKIYRMYCCEDHLNVEEDLRNYHRWRTSGVKPRLKSTAKLRNIPDMPILGTLNNTSRKRKVKLPSSSQDSELMKLLLQPVENSMQQPTKRKQLAQDILPSSFVSTQPLMVDASTQCQIQMVDKSTNYIKQEKNIHIHECQSSALNPSVLPFTY